MVDIVERGQGIAGDERRPGALTLRRLQCAMHVRSAAAGRDSDHQVLGAHAPGFQVRGSRLGVVLGSLDGPGQGLGPPGNQPLEPLGRGREGRRNLGRIQDAQPPARSRADIEDPSPLADRLSGRFGHLGDRRSLLRDRFDRPRVLGAHQSGDLAG
ncbi:hypothetical protein D3C86_1585030 [compost metagenome]